MLGCLPQGSLGFIVGATLPCRILLRRSWLGAPLSVGQPADARNRAFLAGDSGNSLDPPIVLKGVSANPWLLLQARVRIFVLSLFPSRTAKTI